MMGEVYPAAVRSCKAWRLAALAMAAVAAAMPLARADDGAAAAPAGPLALGVHEARLANGLTILTVERPQAPRATCWLFMKTGSVNERPGITGISHVFEHLMFKGTHRIGVRDYALDQKIEEELDAAWVALREAPDDAARAAAEARFAELKKKEKANDIQDELWDLFLANGATGLNAFTTEDVTAYIATVPANKTELFMWLWADELKEAVFREFYAERDVVKEERRLDENRPDGPYYEELNALFYMAQPYHWPVLGWMSDIDAITPADLRRYWDVFYAPNNAVLVVVGAVKHEEIERQADRYFGPIPRGKTEPPKVRTQEPAPAGERRLTVEAEARPRATLLFMCPKLGEADGPALEVAQAMLTGNSGRLWSKLVEDLELCVETSADFTQRRYAGQFQVEGYAKGETSPEKVLDALQEELDKLAAEGPKPDELERAKTRLEAGLMRKLEEPESFTETLGWYAAVADWRYLEKLPALWRAVGAEDVKRVAAKYLAKKKRVVGILTTAGGGEGEGKDDDDDKKPAKPGDDQKKGAMEKDGAGEGGE
jgi:predicted Zn-dependent peptidase